MFRQFLSFSELQTRSLCFILFPFFSLSIVLKIERK